MPLNWPTSQLRNLADVRVSNVDKKSYATERPIRLCNYMDVYANDYLTSALLDFMPATASPSEIERFALHAGDVVITKDSETPDDIGVPAVIVEDIDGLVCGYHLALIRPKASVHPTFLAKQLASAPTIRYFAANATGSTRFGLAIGTIEKLDVPTPPIAEQSKIAEVLSTVDRAIEQTEALIAKQQRIKTGLMQDLLTRGIDEHGNHRSEQTHKFKDSPLGRIPVEWDIASLGSVAECVTSGSRGWAKYYSEDGALFIRIGNLTREHINLRLDDLVFVQPPESAEGLRTAAQADDLLISVTADLGVIGVIPKGFMEGYVNQHIALSRLRPADVSARFVGWFLSSREGKAQFDTLNESGAKAGLNLPTVRSLLFPRPDVDEQHRIAVAIDACVRTVDQHACSLRKLRALKRGLMQDLLTGNRRVTALLEQGEGATA